jgi:hypothetical protein
MSAKLVGLSLAAALMMSGSALECAAALFMVRRNIGLQR